MSGPFRFNQESARSPLYVVSPSLMELPETDVPSSDRQAPNLFAAGQPPSFKTNVNRMKTKKWVEAKKNAYDGDDWGDYDEYDEYGVDDAPPPQPAASAYRPSPYGQRMEQPSRSFTDPQRQGMPPVARRNSFEAGDEHRSFSASMAPPPVPMQHHQQDYHEPAHPPNRQASAAESDMTDTLEHRRDYSPTAMPPPLQTRFSPPPQSNTSSPNTQFPPRKSSIGQVDSPSAMSPRSRAPSNPQKPLPFIRPADIYKRHEEERQRASLDSGRPSLDSLSSRPRDDATSPPPQGSDAQAKSPDAAKSLHPLETVAERKSEYLPDFDVAAQGRGKAPEQAQGRVSQPAEAVSAAFDNDFWSSSPPTQLQDSYTPVTSPPDDNGFRNVVNQAFTRTDDSRSVPPTPITQQDSSMSRSNTNSTAGISPIMSRVPSSATSALKTRNQTGEGSTPAIAEEPSDTTTPVSRPTSSAMLGGSYQVPRKPSPSHSRNVSSTSLATPSGRDSPARSPVVEPQKSLPEPETAQLSALSPESPEDFEGGLAGPSSAYATREADMATTAMDPNKAELTAAQKESQDAFLESHHSTSPIGDALPRERSESPSKGRVQQLAGRFGEVSHSRRGSTQSNASRNSVQSWERSPNNSLPPSPTKGNSRPSSPTKTAGERPAAAREASFRPKLPGQWESFATSVQTPSEQGDKEIKPADAQGQQASPLGEVDLTPTTAKHPVSDSEPQVTSEPLAALKAAGAAMGEAIQASVGGASQSRDDHKPSQEQQPGDVYMSRPVHLDRAESSVSTIPPTPPAKDTPESEEMPPPPPLKQISPEPNSPSSPRNATERPSFVPQLSMDPSADDQESDRLRKEIVASLSPSPLSIRNSIVAPPDANRASLQPGTGAEVNRASSILPSEYESYWADGDSASPRVSRDVGAHAPEHAVSKAEPATGATPSGPARPSILTRFSWEANSSHAATPDEQAQAGAKAENVKSPSPEQKSSPTVARVASTQSFEAIPDTYFGPGYTAASKPEPLKESDLAKVAPEPLDSGKQLASPSHENVSREPSPALGLHVVNSALNPEAVDMPPRLSADASPQQQKSTSEETTEAAKSTEQTKLAEQAEASLEQAKPAIDTTHDRSSAPGSAAGSVPSSAVDPKPLGFRDIAAMKSTSERITLYNKTRDYWAHMDHGLGNWISSTISANPDLAVQSYPQPPAVAQAASSARHKHTGSLSLFGKHSSNPSNQGPAYYEQYNTAASQVLSTPASSAAVSDLKGSHSGFLGRTASHNMQSKGKDLLHSAGVLGGKGMTGAKGLFAKGKSRFKSDKVDK